MQKYLKYLFLALAVALSVVLTGCPSGGGSSSGGGVSSPTTPSGGGTVNGLVTDFAKGTRLSGVTVTGGGQSTTTDSNGRFTLSGFSAGSSIPVTISMSNYAIGYGNAEIGINAAPLIVPLKKELGSRKPLNQSVGGTISFSTEAGPYAVKFTANSMDTTETNLTVSVTPLDPTKESSVLPGNLSASSGGNRTVLGQLTFAEFSIFNSAGNRVNLKPGSSAIVEMPIPPELRKKAEYQIGQKVHCYSYNPVTGKWEDFIEGTVVTSSVDGITPVLSATILHFSWYGGAPQGTDCYNVYGTVVSAVDGKPLPFARVEAFPGTATTSDANGNFVVTTTAGGPNSFTASRTFVDTDGSVSGMAGAKVIEFGKVDGGDLLVGLTKVPCSSTVPPPPPTPPLPPTAITIKIGGVSLLSYKINAYLFTGGACATVNEVLPDGNVGADVTGAIVKLNGPGGPYNLTEATSGTPGLYCAFFTPTSGARYTLTVDADHNGSIDGTGSVTAVGTITSVTPANGVTYSASTFQPQWADSGTATSGYSVVYFVFISKSDQTAYSMYTWSELQFTAYNLASGTPNQPLPAGTYTEQIFAFSGSYKPGSGNWEQTSNITGANVSGEFYSVGSPSSSITFTLN